MTEVSIGVLFAAWFVTAYLLVAKLFKAQKTRFTLRRCWRQPTYDVTQIAAGKKPQLFLTTQELSQHHSQSKTQRGTVQQ